VLAAHFGVLWLIRFRSNHANILEVFRFFQPTSSQISAQCLHTSAINLHISPACGAFSEMNLAAEVQAAAQRRQSRQQLIPSCEFKDPE
jgi:hypothetical protein